jgi:hypothetical protein
VGGYTIAQVIMKECYKCLMVASYEHEVFLCWYNERMKVEATNTSSPLSMNLWEGAFRLNENLQVMPILK